ncbi:histamine H2 receptor-like [Stylophora pistillata]|uniref:histamine H2 receptor-like n=1 Tax=Stylophora pistillata TaxID=50429 RepID=UPI000C039918|nr:histamine H2 receptor-like [Stylophora pistillata]
MDPVIIFSSVRKGRLLSIYTDLRFGDVLKNFNLHILSESKTMVEIHQISSVKVVLVSINVVSGVLSVAGNSITLLALYRTASLRKNTSNFFLASLALADLTVGLFANSLYLALCGFISLQEIQELKNAETAVWLLTTTASTFNLCFVAVDRYIAILHPLRYREIITKKRILWSVICMWIFTILFSTVSFYLPYKHLPKLWIIGSLVTFFLPLAVLLLCYYRVYNVAKAQSSWWKRHRTFNCPVLAAEELKHRKAAVTFAIVTGLFVFLFLPTLVVNFLAILLRGYCHRFRINIAWFWVAAISYSSSAINPWIYAIRMTDFRRAIKQILCS